MPKTSPVCKNNELETASQEQNSFAEAFISGALPLSEYNMLTKNLNEKIRTLKNKDKNISATDSDSNNNLYKRYLRKKLTDEEYLFLLKNTLNKITVFQEKVIFDTKYGIFECDRKIFKRQKGISRRYKKLE